MAVDLEKERLLYVFTDYLVEKNSSVLRHSQLINDKASAILAHISLMVAAATFSLDKYGKTFLLEIVIYSFICLILMLSVWMIDANFVKIGDHNERNLDKFMENVAKRRFYLRSAIFMTSITTCIFILHLVYSAIDKN